MGYSKADLFECKDNVKGDVARILLYIYCRWEQPQSHPLRC
ncbi:MAG: endonuclease [Ruminococcus sp.]|nr:endonuclease [Ruminococcus sp.]